MFGVFSVDFFCFVVSSEAVLAWTHTWRPLEDSVGAEMKELRMRREQWVCMLQREERLPDHRLPRKNPVTGRTHGLRKPMFLCFKVV